ncbi:g5498 [Coccomyxa elongata]
MRSKEECFQVTKAELQIFHSQLQKDRPHSFKSEGQMCWLVAHVINWWTQYCEHEAGLAGAPAANYTLVQTPPDDSRQEKTASSRLQRFYEWMLPHVQSRATNTHHGILDKFETTFRGLLFMQFQREGTPADVKEKWTYWKQVDIDQLKPRRDALRRVNRQARADPVKTDIQGKPVGKTVTDDYVSLILNTQHYQCRLQLNDHLASQAQLAVILVCGNRGVRERRKKLICVTSKPVREKEMEILKGPCVQHLRQKVGMVVDATHGDKPRSAGDRTLKLAMFSVDGLFRKENVLQCPVWKLAQYLRHRSLMPGLSLESNLCSQQQLLNYLDAPLYLTSTGAAYANRKLLDHLDIMKVAAGLRKEHGSGVHAWRNKALEESQLHHNDKAMAERLLDHSWDIHDDFYAFCNYPNIKESAQLAGHVDGHVLLYRTGLWASESPKFRPLYDDINWIGDKEYEVALQLVGPRRRQGTELWMKACRFLADTLLQDLVAVMRLTDMDTTILRDRTCDFPFLASAHKNHTLFVEFYVASGRYYEALAAADAAALQPPPPPTPAQAAGQKRKLEESELPQVVMLPAVWFPDPQLSAKTVKSGDMEMACKLAHKDDNPLKSRTSILTVSCVYDMFDKKLLPTLPPLQEVYMAQGYGWRVGLSANFLGSLKYMQKVWAYVNIKRRSGMERNQAIDAAHQEYKEWRDVRGDTGSIKKWTDDVMTRKGNPAEGPWWLVQ